MKRQFGTKAAAITDMFTTALQSTIPSIVLDSSFTMLSSRFHRSREHCKRRESLECKRMFLQQLTSSGQQFPECSKPSLFSAVYFRLGTGFSPSTLLIPHILIPVRQHKRAGEKSERVRRREFRENWLDDSRSGQTETLCRVNTEMGSLSSFQFLVPSKQLSLLISVQSSLSA